MSTRYRIRAITNLVGEPRFVVQVKGWIFWHDDEVWNKTLDEAQERITTLKKMAMIS